MLLPININPKDSIFYVSTLILQHIVENNVSEQNWLDLYSDINKKEKITPRMFVFGLDWLYLINEINIDKKGRIYRCL
ncbi:ABC-three component system middle component 6 [Mycoplasma sp. Ms02]|uniref:ABC-three component system middle component 6 n=1 Tax=Mycoplasma sp. Ms02 TaxID=353851 RepID=UPI001C8A1223|nr:ABC-three component system middle component 6 [Mycoplasma sp. Ms02]QZE12456.1 hypothetical protein K4L35_00480 [Mycoplasma sp. Ms02]